ncbi:alanine/glycine:cation symporter family protein [Candidatus Riesia pediculicola]|uniref:Sodium/alanine symporter n=1 Tax=Riesia pediculicola (strain USDA) TaxID=515618 RepID=D4G8V3_RIEPU|nr:alanine/glycine:cation symporter family protein [Candidatus Riesia pediculicola]ADD79655.1 sodium/alanine symporter [Candidatus Riesia pediculicola USDA]ARC53965.1 sodium:alanine symporter [Candidatus Riesia pediculicola]QOJ86592.1 alanine:cation symporter family protein [Candidatus Riesia pediculicola]
MTRLIDKLNNFLWDHLLIYFLILVGIYLTVGTRFIQIKHFFHMFTILRGSNKSNKSGISSFQALCTTLASRVGTGNLTGVAIALNLGGVGSIFWMWVAAIIGMATSFSESILAQLYKTIDKKGRYYGGPSYYMEKGLNMRWMGTLFSILLIISFGLIFNSVQSNSIVKAASLAFNVNSLHVGTCLSMICGIVIFGGLRSVSKVSEFIVPFMAITYLFLSCWAIGKNVNQLFEVFFSIIKNAFGIGEACSGIAGYSFSQIMVQGFKRGLFSNEAGMGSTPNAAASASPYPPHPVSQGYIQMLGVFIDTMIICSTTAIVIISSGVLNNTNDSINGIELTQMAVSHFFGDFGKFFISISTFFFSFTSIISNYCYAESNIIFLKKNDSYSLFMLRVCTIVMIIFGTYVETPLVWKLADISMGCMTIINLIAIFLLSKLIFMLTRDYHLQIKEGKIPKFNIKKYPNIQIKYDVWGK